MRRGQRGFNLLEILVAMFIGLTLIATFLVVLQRSRRDFAVNESLATLQDSARHALAVMAVDIENAGFYGFARGRVQLTRGGPAAVVVAADTALAQPTASLAVLPVAGLPAGAHDCGANFAVDLLLAAQGADNHYALGAGARACAPTGTAGGAAGDADTLTLRHASLATALPRVGRLQVYSAARARNGPLQLFADGIAPGPVDSDHEIRDLEVRSYYIANNSVARRGWPALRVKSLTESRGAAQFRDDEVMPGVEDLQVEFVVEATEGGVPVLRSVAADSERVVSERIVAIRVWLRIRADTTESGYRDARPLTYANVEFLPSTSETRQRRLLVERTVALRNARS
ncbi:MAG TPA: PilW family protein [Steroidobacteraceae bacterium]|nr:PilW family protein [Steroidobacteraceae bacterium]